MLLFEMDRVRPLRQAQGERVCYWNRCVCSVRAELVEAGTRFTRNTWLRKPR